MKKILTILVATFILSACQSNPTVPTAASEEVVTADSSTLTSELPAAVALTTEELNILFAPGQIFSATFKGNGKSAIPIHIYSGRIEMHVGGGKVFNRTFKIEDGLFKKQKSPNLEIYPDPIEADTYLGRKPGSDKINLILVKK